MARVSHAAQLKNLQGLVREGADWRQHADREHKWKRMVDLYRGRHYAVQSADHRLVINMAFSTKNIIAPSVAISNPKFSISARKPEGAAQAVITEEVLNYLWRTYKYQKDFRLSVDDMLVFGHGWLKVGYKATKAPQVVVADEQAPDDAESEGVDDRDETVEGNVESELESDWDDDRPFLERMSPWDIFVDPHARHPKEMKWICQRIQRPVNDVKVDKRYEKAVREKASADASSRFTQGGGDGRETSDTPSDSSVQYCEVIEFYDLRRKEVSTFLASGGGGDVPSTEEGFLIKPKKFPYAFGHPFIMLRNYEVPDHFYPMGELEAIEILQLELNETRTQMLNHRSKFARKYLIHEASFDANGIKALKSSKDNEMVPFDGDIDDMGKAVLAMPVQGTPPDFYNQSELIQTDMDRVSGVSDYMSGAQAQIRRTATEAAMIQDAQNARASDKLSSIEQTLAECGEKLIMLMQQYMTGEHVIRIVGLSQPTWVKIDSDFIQGQFDYEVEAGSTQPRNESFKQQHALQLVDAMSAFQGIVNPHQLAQHVLRSFGIKDPSAYLMDPSQMGQDPNAPGGEMPPGGPPQQMPPQMPPEMGPMGSSAPPMEEESPIPGIPPELVAQLMGKSGLDPMMA